MSPFDGARSGCLICANQLFMLVHDELWSCYAERPNRDDVNFWCAFTTGAYCARDASGAPILPDLLKQMCEAHRKLALKAFDKVST